MRRSWTAFGAAAVAVCILLLPPLIEGGPAQAGQIGQESYSGSLLYLSRAGIWRINLATLERQPFLQEPGAIITHVSHSWDRQRLAYSALVRGARFEILQSRILVAAADGSEPRTVVEEAGSGATVEWPSWSPDGAALVYEKSVPSERTQRVEEVHLATGERRLVAEAGSSPAFAPNGQSIAFASAAGRPASIWQIPRGGRDPIRVVPETGFADLDSPLYAPDGRFIAFVGATIPGPPDPLSPPVALFGAELFSVASAHPVPGGQFDFWTVRPDSSGLQRGAELLSEQPYLAWSPDGRFIAAWGRLGLQIVDVSSDVAGEYPVRWLTGLPGGGPISWGP